MPTQKDNSTFREKVTLREKALSWLDEKGIGQPVVMETHGGEGHLFAACYAHLGEGVVFEQDSVKVDRLAKQRPGWRVYEADCTVALGAGVASDLPIDLLDVDPYGGAWDALEAFFFSDRQFALQMVVVVQDGLRLKLASGTAWEVKVLAPMVRKYGNDLHPIYLDVCGEMLAQIVANAGYEVTHFGGYHTGHSLAMTHYAAWLERKQDG